MNRNLKRKYLYKCFFAVFFIYVHYSLITFAWIKHRAEDFFLYAEQSNDLFSYLPFVYRIGTKGSCFLDKTIPGYTHTVDSIWQFGVQKLNFICAAALWLKERFNLYTVILSPQHLCHPRSSQVLFTDYPLHVTLFKRSLCNSTTSFLKFKETKIE